MKCYICFELAKCFFYPIRRYKLGVCWKHAVEVNKIQYAVYEIEDEANQ